LRASTQSKIFYIPIQLNVPPPANITAMNIYYDELVNLLGKAISSPFIGFVVDIEPIQQDACASNTSTYNGTFFVCLTSHVQSAQFIPSQTIQNFLQRLSLNYIDSVNAISITQSAAGPQVSTGQISGIVIAVLIVVISLGLAAGYFIMRKQRKSSEKIVIKTITKTTDLPKKSVKIFIDRNNLPNDTKNPLMIATVPKSTDSNNSGDKGSKRIILEPIQVNGVRTIPRPPQVPKVRPIEASLERRLSNPIIVNQYKTYNSTPLHPPPSTESNINVMKTLISDRRNSIRVFPPVKATTFEPIQVKENDYKPVSVRELLSRFEKPNLSIRKLPILEINTSKNIIKQDDTIRDGKTFTYYTPEKLMREEGVKSSSI